MNCNSSRFNGYVILSTKINEYIKNALNQFPMGLLKKINQERFLFRSSNNTPIYLSIINDINDYQQDNVKISCAKSKDSLVSYATIDNNVIILETDFWGIQNHFYYIDSDTFIASNNIFIVKSILDKKITFDIESIYEYLFFGAPLNDKTWFSGINCLKPGQSISYSLNTEKLKISAPINFQEELMKPACSIIEASDYYYKNVKNVIRDKPVCLSLSAGSDSQSILAGLNYYKYNVRCVTWGEDNYLEKDRVKLLIENLSLASSFIPISKFRIDHQEYFLRGSFVTNGFMNPLRTHYYEIYQKDIKCNNYFEGILGSEFVKGEISIPTMTSTLMKEVISDKKTVEQVIEKYYAELTTEFKSKFVQYIQDVHSNYLIDINTRNGLNNYAIYAFQFIPSKIFSGLILLIKDNRKVYYPYLNQKILNSVFWNGYGIVNTNSISNKFNHRLKSIVPESIIVQKYNKNIFVNVLDRGISFKDALNNEIILKAKKMKSKIKARISYDESKFGGQIDNLEIKRKLIVNAANISNPILPLNKRSDNINISKALITYECLDKCK